MGANRQAHIRCALAPDIMAQDVMVQDVMARGCAASNNDANALTMRGCRSAKRKNAFELLLSTTFEGGRRYARAGKLGF
jgi:ribose 5-phosphate isomerase RpiB